MICQNRPIFFTESGKYNGVSDDQRAFYEHTVACEKADLFFFTHRRQFVLELHGTVQLSARIKKFSDRQAAAADPFGQFFKRRILFFDRPLGIGNTVVVQPLFCFFTGRTPGITKKQHSFISPF